MKQETDWLREPDKFALQNALRDLDAAYKNFFRRVKQGEKPGFPNFKSKHHNRQSYRTQCQGTSIAVLEKQIKLPKLGLIECRVSGKVDGRILSATISKSPSGKYFVSVCCADVEIPCKEQTGVLVGLDLGLKDICITSDGATYANHKHLAASTKKLAKLQRQLSRKQNGSSNRNTSAHGMESVWSRSTSSIQAARRAANAGTATRKPRIWAFENGVAQSAVPITIET